MRGTSVRWDQAVKRSHTITAAVEITDREGRVIASTFENSSPRLAVVDGEVQVDRGAHIRRSLALELAIDDPRILPLKAADLLSVVSGNEIRPYRGIRFADGAEEMIPLGVFGLAEAPHDDSPSSFNLKVTGFDRSRRIARNRWDKVLQIAHGTNVISAAQTVIRDRMPGVVFKVLASTGHVTPALTFDESTQNPWMEAHKICSSAGLEVYFDVEGTCVIAEEPDPNSPYARLAARYGEDDQADTVAASILSVSRATSNEQVYNGVIVTGEATSNAAPVRAVAWDDDPQSPTYYLGSYGKVTTYETSQYITTTEQALAAARGRLKQTKSATEVISMQTIVNAAHEETDVIEITRARSGTAGLFVLDGFNVPLRSNRMMQIRTRKRYVPA